MDIKLLPCPFCGGEPRLTVDDGVPPEVWVHCPNCGEFHQEFHTKESAIIDWNTRYYPPQLRICATCKYVVGEQDNSIECRYACPDAFSWRKVRFNDRCKHWEIK